MEEHPHKWIQNAILVGLGWLFLELVAGLIHVWMMKKAKICPYMDSLAALKTKHQ
jgi:hypothetical protein